MNPTKYLFESDRIVVLTSSPLRKKVGLSSHTPHRQLCKRPGFSSVPSHGSDRTSCTIALISPISTAQKKSWSGKKDTEF